MEKGETGVDISSREIGRNIKDEAAENDGEDNKNGRLPNKCLALSCRFSSVPSGVTVRVIHYRLLTGFQYCGIAAGTLNSLPQSNINQK